MGLISTIVIAVVVFLVLVLLFQLFYRQYTDSDGECARCVMERSRAGTEEDFKDVTPEGDVEMDDDDDSDGDISEDDEL